MTQTRQEQYLNLIDQLLRCPNGQEPEVLDAQMDLIDAGLVQTMMQVATVMTHENNPNGARFLIHVARELAKQLGLYPQLNSDGIEVSGQ
ncbi:MAG TPA: hypothetical protein DCL61_16620 [Cyanobacteria bacterium UBA12227]|nr:hypothetical protein [Cyanobacteria bacterium UBA12227]HAX87927.1 hypothetical protein [Cyanobacteria bacterium UBA11370]HBY80819.1 hypothetical protein [Cyanobacteria bacterium UBA11148]